MKRFLVLLFMIAVSSVSVNATEATKPSPQQTNSMQAKIIAQQKHHRMFEERLKLTEVQKLKAKNIRQAGHEKLKPIIDQIQSKKQEAEMVRRSRMAVQMQEEKLTVIDAELKDLEKQAQKIRKENMKEFESILTWQQRKVLKDMKKEGRKNYRQNHCPHRPPMMK